MTVSDYPDWSAPQTNANAIATTGVPLINNPNQVITVSSTINPGITWISNTVPVGQVGYEINLQANESGSGSAGPLQILVTWSDAVFGGTIDAQTYTVWPGGLSTVHTLTGRGPTRGGKVQIQITNLSSAMVYAYTFNMWESSHPYTRDDWRSTLYPSSASGNAIAINDPTSSFIGYRNTSVAASGSDITELPLYSGPCLLFAETGSGTNDLLVNIQDSANPSLPALGTKVMLFQTGATGLFSQEITLPRYQCRVQLLNNNAAAKTCQYTLLAIEQPA